MSAPHPMLHLVYGKPASGKSTLTESLGQRARTVVISEDIWLSALFGDQMDTLEDYIRCASKLRAVLGPHVANLLNAGTDVVLDFPANTIKTRAWMRSILEATDAAHELHVLDVPDAVCLQRLKARNDAGDHPFSVTEAQFRRICQHIEAPSPEEGFNIVMHSGDGQQGTAGL